MIPFLPDASVSPGPTPFGSVPPGAAAPGLLTQPGAALRGGGNTAGGGLDFAGLLNAALPEGEAPAPALTNLPASVPELGSQRPAALSAAAPIAAPPADPASLPVLLREVPQPPATRLPTGTLLPESGAIVPQPESPSDVSEAMLSDHSPAETPTIAPETNPAPITPEAAASVIAVQLRADTSDEPQEPAKPISLTESEEMAEALLVSATPVPVAAPIIVASTTPAPGAARAAVRSDEPRAGPAVRPEHRAAPARIALPDTESDAATAPAAAAMLAEAPPSTAANTAQQPAPTTAPLAPTPAAAAAMAERAEPRAPGANQESAIAQVGELREALRAARPEMTLRHADFGFVSLRIEPTGTQDWRAVLASRDPGFVPAIHAALAERTIAATADTAGANANAGQNGTSDQRYGSSPNGGQGSSQPYLSQYGAQSEGRDEGQSSHRQNRQPSTTDAVVARADEADGERPNRSERGVFA